MQVIELNLRDESRKRDVPVCIYIPKNNKVENIVIFGPGYQGQEDLAKEEMVYKKYKYLAKFFTQRNFAFISIQHDILGDKDGLESIDTKLPQYQARKHLYERGQENINYVLEELGKRYPSFNLNRFIIAGHSNGGDIAKFYACNYPEKISHIIALDSRRALIEGNKNLKILMFEAEDTTTDTGVIPDPTFKNNARRIGLEWVIIKPREAKHISYSDTYINDDIKKIVCNSIGWFLDNF